MTKQQAIRRAYGELLASCRESERAGLLDQPLKMVNLVANGEIEIRPFLELPVEPVVVAALGLYVVDQLDEFGEVGAKANHLITGNGSVKGCYPFVHGTNIQNKAQQFANKFANAK